MARLHLEIAVEDDRFRVPTYVALYVVIGDRFERVTTPDTFQIDAYGDQHVTLEPEYTLYGTDEDVLVAQGSTLYLRQPDGKYATKNGESDEGRALLDRFGPQRETVVALGAQIDALMQLPTALEMWDGRLLATRQGTSIEMGDRSSLLDTKPAGEMGAELCIMNEGALVRVYEGWSPSPERARSLFLLRPGAKKFDPVARAEWPMFEAAIARRPRPFTIQWTA